MTYGTADALNRYPTVGGTTYTWAPEGTLSSNTTWDFVYDEENRLIWSGKLSINTGDWTPHDALGVPYARQTVAPTGTDTLTYFTNDASRPEVMFERLLSKPAGAGSWNTVGDRAYLPGVLPDERLLFKDTDGALRYPHTDRQGTTIALSQAGSAVAKFKYDPFGQSPDPVTSAPSASSYWWRFTGQRLNPFNGTYNYKTRTLSSYLGRFLQPDPLRYLEGPNLYSYVDNNPVNQLDSTGMQGCADIGAEGQSGLSGVCIDAPRFSPLKDGSQTTVSTPEIDLSALKNMPLIANDKGPKENIAQFDQEGSDVKFTPLSTITREGVRTYKGIATAIGDPEAIGHSHPNLGRSSNLQPGYEDRKTGDHIQVNSGRPNYIVNSGKTIVIERSQGQFRARVIDGSLTRSEVRDIDRGLNRLQTGSR